MFCMLHSSRPPAVCVPSGSVSAFFLLRFTSRPGSAPSGVRDASSTRPRETYSTFVFAGKALFAASEPVPSASTATSSMPYLANSVYSMLLTAYSHRSSPLSGSRTRLSTSTLAPSDAPGVRVQDAKPNALSPRRPVPASARRVVSMPAMGLLICRTRPALRPCSALSHRSTPPSAMSFHIAPCPPGFTVGLITASSAHRPWPATVHTGTMGCLNSLNDLRPRPNHPICSHRPRSLAWLSFASDVMIATGVVSCRPKSWKWRYSRACRSLMRPSSSVRPAYGSSATGRLSPVSSSLRPRRSPAPPRGSTSAISGMASSPQYAALRA
mmetsp:Transcript_18481/g.62947  ORF Transcript_18481/g.62947 Transcript_18481/m.62947 type:complete len:326 (+) Transcript_18481:2495-3472(+)